MAALEPPDRFISLARASELSGVAHETLRAQRRRGRLRAEKIGRDWLTTRRWLHNYLIGRGNGYHGGRRVPLPADYRVPDDGL
jgi:hypothetical protein